MTTQEQMPANAKVQAEVSVLPHVNLALMQNGLPVVQGLAVSNTCDEPLQDVVCAFSSEEGFIVPSQVSFREIGAKETVRRPNVDVLLNQRRVLEMRYRNYMTWEDIAREIPCDVRTVYRLHGRALLNIHVPEVIERPASPD